MDWLVYVEYVCVGVLEVVFFGDVLMEGSCACFVWIECCCELCGCLYEEFFFFVFVVGVLG